MPWGGKKKMTARCMETMETKFNDLLGEEIMDHGKRERRWNIWIVRHFDWFLFLWNLTLTPPCLSWPNVFAHITKVNIVWGGCLMWGRDCEVQSCEESLFAKNVCEIFYIEFILYFFVFQLLDDVCARVLGKWTRFHELARSVDILGICRSISLTREAIF